MTCKMEKYNLIGIAIFNTSLVNKSNANFMDSGSANKYRKVQMIR